MKNRQRTVTMKEVAEEAGVSRMVVSSVLNNKRMGNIGFSEATRQSVLKAVETLGYRLNRAALSMRGKGNGVIGVLVPSMNAIPGRVLEFLIKLSSLYDKVIEIELLEDGKRPKMTTEDAVDAVLVFESLPAEIQAYIDKIELALVQVNTNQRYATGCITFDEEGGVSLAVERLKNNNRKNIAYLQLPETDHYSYESRMNGFRTGMESNEWISSSIVSLSSNSDREDDISQFLESTPNTDACILQSSSLAPAFYRAAARAGREISKDLDVIAFDDGPIWLGCLPSLTALYVNPVQLARTIYAIVTGLLGDIGEVPSLSMSYSLYERESG